MWTTRSWSWVALVALLACSATPSTARAANEEEQETGGSTSAEARKKFAEGNEKYARGDYDGAIEAFKGAIAADPKLPGPYRNLGLAYRAQNRCSDALPMYEKYLELKPESRFTDRVRREIDLCRAKLGQAPLPTQPRATPGQYTQPEAQSFLHVAANMVGGEVTDEALVRIDGIVRGPTPLTVPVRAGVHQVHLERQGFEPADATIEVGPGERRDLELTMNKLAEAPAAAAAAEPVDTTPKVSYRKYGWALLGVAAAAAAVGAGFGIAESKKHRDAVAADHATTSREDVIKLQNDGNNYATAAWVGLGVGGAALAAAVIIFIVDPSRGETHAKKPDYLSISPLAGPSGGGLQASGSF